MPRSSRASAGTPDERDVFINCPFDRAYRPLFRAIVFAIQACSFRPRCALEEDNGGAVRIGIITRLITQCRLSVHDLSRTDLSARGGLPRFNMPLELGLFLGALQFGGKAHRTKRCLILDTKTHRYRAFISDIAGQKVGVHGDKPAKAIARVRDFLRASTGDTLPGGKAIANDYERFQADLPAMLREARLRATEITFPDYTEFVAQWLTATGGQD